MEAAVETADEAMGELKLRDYEIERAAKPLAALKASDITETPVLVLTAPALDLVSMRARCLRSSRIGPPTREKRVELATWFTHFSGWIRGA
jgi:hypothetical protein